MDKFLFTDKDNIFLSLKTTTVDQMLSLIHIYTYMCNRIERDFRQHGEDADKHDRDYKQTYIPIADMSKMCIRDRS